MPNQNVTMTILNTKFIETHDMLYTIYRNTRHAIYYL